MNARRDGIAAFTGPLSESDTDLAHNNSNCEVPWTGILASNVALFTVSFLLHPMHNERK